MKSDRAKRVGALLGILIGLLALGAGYLAFEATRDVSFDWENPNNLEADSARRKIRSYENSLAARQLGWVFFSQLEINSYLMSAATNAPAEGARYKLKRVAVELTTTNATLYSWGERKVLGFPLNFVVQRTFHVVQNSTNAWDMPMEAVRVGELDVPPKLWRRMRPAMNALDQPLAEYLRWGTNIQGVAVAKSRVSDRPELRLYTYRPGPADLR